jgi:hypothetical protein
MVAAGALVAPTARAQEGTGSSSASPGEEGDSARDREAPRVTPETCTYRTYSWSVEERRAVNRERVEKPYDEVDDDERDPTDPRCTVCLEDQSEIDPALLGLEGLEPFRVCYAYRNAIEDALRRIAESGDFEIVEITGYRVGRTRGRVVDGLRTEWSNHSFGTAIDINADYNGLYGSCDVDEVTPESLAGCRRRVGGDWDPASHPRRTVVRGGVVYEAFTGELGWRWGGEIEGATRDMMHFSLTGY